MANASAPQSAPFRIPPATVFIAGLAAALLLRFCLMQLLLRNGFVLSTMDEAIRWTIAWNWHEVPYWFSHWDGIWLTGHQFFWGTLIRLIPNPLLSIQVGVILNHILSLAGIGWFAWMLARNAPAGVAAMLLAAAGFPFLWMGNGALVEPLLVACMGLAGGASLLLLRQPLGSPVRRWAFAALTGLALFLITTLHYVGWMSIAFAFPFYLIAVVQQARRTPAARQWALWSPWLLVGLAAIVFPLLWFYGSWRYLGHPLQFLRNQDAASIGAYAERGLTPVTALMMLPRELALQLAPLLVLLPLLFLRSVRARLNSGSLAVLGFSLLLFAFQEFSALRGAFSISAYRNVIVEYVMVLVLAGGLLGPAVADARPRLRATAPRIAFALLLLVLAGGWSGYNFIIANRAEQHLTEDMPHDVIAMAELLRQEYRRPQMLPEYGETTRIAVVSPTFVYEWSMWFAYATGTPGRFVPIPNPPDTTMSPDINAIAAFTGQYLLIHGRPAPAGWRPLVTVGAWTIHARTGS